jgi:hypothetical protein
MHDIGRTQLETEAWEAGHEIGEFGEIGEIGEIGEFGEYGEHGEAGPGEYGEFSESESPLSEAQEVELASELLEISSEEELEQFLGNLIGTVGRAIGGFARSGTGRALGGILTNAAKQALPVVGRGIGQWVSPGRGGDVGATLGTAAGQLLGLELEGLSAEDREFEVAKQFVRFAGSAVKQAATAPPSASPQTAARIGAAKAASVHAPGLLPQLRGVGPTPPTTMQQSGRWLRRGRRIVIYLS